MAGEGGRTLRVRRYRPAGARGRVAVVYPGVGYNADMPLLYYAALVLHGRGWEVLAPRFDYPEVGGFPPFGSEEQWAWIAADAARVLALAGEPARLALVGKSLGTRQVAALLEEGVAPEVVALLTPTLRYARVRDATSGFAGRVLWVAGTADEHHFDAAAWAEVTARPRAAGHLVEGADHGMEIPGDAAGSARVLAGIAEALGGFLDDAG